MRDYARLYPLARKTFEKSCRMPREWHNAQVMRWVQMYGTSFVSIFNREQAYL